MIFEHIEDFDIIIEIDEDKYDISRYVCGYLQTTIDIITKYLPDNSFIILPVYDEDFTFQCQVSGKCKIEEKYEEAVQREILEEIGMNIKNSTFVYKDKHNYYNKKTNLDIENEISYFVSDISKSEKISYEMSKELSSIKERNIVKDDLSKRICVFLYIEYEDLSKLNDVKFHNTLQKIYDRQRIVEGEEGKSILIYHKKKLLEKLNEKANLYKISGLM